MADDVDFVTVADVSSKSFKRTVVCKGVVCESLKRPLNKLPDMAVVHWSWRIDSDKSFDGTPRPPRFGMMTMVAQKRGGTWQVVVAQNTNSELGTPPELQDITSPIPVPGPTAKPFQLAR
jgi:hypothetical protein